MQVKWLTKGISDTLHIYVLGWAAHESMIAQILDESCDVVCVYDYRHIERFEVPVYYRNTILTAWSYGVWACEHILHNVEFSSATAINGTPLPVDDKFGIPRRVLDLTIKGIECNGLGKFAQRMCNGLKSCITIKRDEAQCIAELKALSNHFTRGYTENIAWNKAIIGGADLIFPPQAQLSYWQSRTVDIEWIENMPHYPFELITK